MKSRKNLLTLMVTALLALSLTSCGGSDETGEVTNTVKKTTKKTTSSSSTLSGEGSVKSATSPSQFRKLVKNGQFAKTDYTLGGYYNTGYYGNQSYIGVAYTVVNVTCTTEMDEHDFLWWDDVFTSVSQDCDSSDQFYRIEYKDGDIVHEYGDTKKEVLNKFLSIIDKADSFELSSGYGSSSTRAYAIKDGKSYLFDLAQPIVANPYLVQDINTSTWNGQYQEGDTEVQYVIQKQGVISK